MHVNNNGCLVGNSGLGDNVYDLGHSVATLVGGHSQVGGAQVGRLNLSANP